MEIIIFYRIAKGYLYLVIATIIDFLIFGS
nr:MAG TPA: hypothetical protein [Caudoviricetes sp.]